MAIEVKGRIIGRIGRLAGLGDIIQKHVFGSTWGPQVKLPMRKMLSDMSVDQENKLISNIRYLNSRNIDELALQNAKGMDELFANAFQQIDFLFKPDAVAFVSNQGINNKLDKAFRLRVGEEALSLSKKTSPIALAYREGLVVYIASLKKGPVILQTETNELFETTFAEAGLKFNRSLLTAYRSLLTVPFYLKGFGVPLGAIDLFWGLEAPIDPSDHLVAFKTARILGGYLAPPLYAFRVKENVKDLPPGFRF